MAGVLEKGIQDKAGNVTRFLVIGNTLAKPLGDGRDKTSLVLSLQDECGALRRALDSFASRGINLCKIESRPSRKKAWDYIFFIDLVGHYSDESVQEALHELEAHCSFVKWLAAIRTLGLSQRSRRLQPSGKKCHRNRLSRV